MRLPKVSEVYVHLGDGAWFKTTVNFVTDRYFALDVPENAPLHLSSGIRYGELEWEHQRRNKTDHQVVPVRILQRQSREGMLIWEAEPTEKPYRIQRRQYIRVPVGNEMTIENVSDESTLGVEHARLVDISEVSLLSVVDDKGWLDAEEGVPVKVEFEVFRQRFSATGRVLRAGRLEGDDHKDLTAVVVMLDGEESFTATLRAAIFDELNDLGQRERRRHDDGLVERTEQLSADTPRRRWWERTGTQPDAHVQGALGPVPQAERARKQA